MPTEAALAVEGLVAVDGVKSFFDQGVPRFADGGVPFAM